MKKKLLILPLVLMALVSCTVEPTSSNSSNGSSSSTSSSSSESSSSSSESSSSSSSSSSETRDPITNIAEMRDLGLSYASLVNDRGVYTSDVKAKFTAQILINHDAWTTEGGYTSRYKVLVANETGRIFVALRKTDYDKFVDYFEKQQVYSFEGYIGIYDNEPEIVVGANDEVKYLSGVTLDYNLDLFTETVSDIATAYTRIKNLKVNTKGTGASSQIVQLTLRYVAKLENSNALFTDGQNMLHVHGHDKINGALSENSTYLVRGILAIFHFKAEILLIDTKFTSDIVTVNYEDIATDISAADVYKLKYNEDHPEYSYNYDYAESFTKLYRFEGYVGDYEKDNALNIVFEDTAKNPYATYQGARDAKALFANNKSCETLYTESDFLNCPFIEFWEDKKEDKVKVEFYFVAYLLNTQGYWQVNALEDTIKPVI